MFFYSLLTTIFPLGSTAAFFIPHRTSLLITHRFFSYTAKSDATVNGNTIERLRKNFGGSSDNKRGGMFVLQVFCTLLLYLNKMAAVIAET
jgi:hypothetical protein